MSAAVIEKCHHLRERYYPRERWPGVIYEETTARLGTAESVLVEIGCGRDGKRLRRMVRSYRVGIGVDMEVAAQTGDGKDAPACWLVLGDVHHLPLQPESVDVVAMANVVEHLTDPVAAFRECARVLRPGGRMVISTVNKWFPFIAASRIMPHRIRQVVNRAASGTADEDTFPVRYRANTATELTTAAAQAGLQAVDVQYIYHHPVYMMFSPTVYRAGIFLERLLRPVAGLRHMIFAIFERKPPSTNGQSPSATVRRHHRPADGSTPIANNSQSAIRNLQLGGPA